MLAAYAGEVGRGFIKEDAAWVLRSRVAAPADLVRPFVRTTGFFRPLVSLSFAANYRMFGAHPRGYGWFNLLLAFATAAAVASFASSLEISSGAALAAGAVWLLNFHGINMAVLWLSGRTALLLTLFAALAGTAAARQRPVLTCFVALLAMLSKEEAVLLPVALVVIACWRWDARRYRAALGLGAGLLFTLAVYFLLRIQSDAATPATAAPFYRFTTSPTVVLSNVREYLHRTFTYAAAASLVAILSVHRRLHLSAADRDRLLVCAVWVLAGFGLTVFLPVRSSLYVCLPSVGAAIAAATVMMRTWDVASLRQRRVLLSLAALVPAVCLPVYWARNTRWTELGDLSNELVRAASEHVPRGGASQYSLVVIDDAANRANAAAALGFALPDAIELSTGIRPVTWIAPPPPLSSEAEHEELPRRADIVLGVSNGHVTDRTGTPLPRQNAARFQ